jgi:hypothetical protein
MTKEHFVKGEQTATEAIRAAGTAQAFDKRGRLIVVKRLTALDYYRLTKALGGANSATYDMASLACTVRKIDTTDYSLPSTEREIEFMLQELDFDGLEAVGIAMKSLLPQDDNDKEAAKN